MDNHRRTTRKCFFTAWILGWVTAIYVPSALVVLAGLSPLSTGRSLPGAVWAAADEVAPFAKIGFAILFGGLLFLARRFAASRRPAAAAVDIVLASIAMLAILALLPEQWSRGFGVGLTGERFAPGATIIYLAGAVLSGLAFWLTEARCLANSKTKP